MAHKNLAYLLVITAKGHYENIGLSLSSKKNMQKLKVKKVDFLRVSTKNPFSIIYAYIFLIFYTINHNEYCYAIHRTNSRALLFLSKLCKKSFFYTYSDGIGDAIHQLQFNKNKKYLGHIGSDLLNKKDLILNIPIKLYVENWYKRIKYWQKGGVLVILKYPLEVPFEKKQIVKLYADLFDNLSNEKIIYVSGNIDSIDLRLWPNIIDIGYMTKLTSTIELSKVYGLPSTMFFTCAAKIHVKNINILPFHIKYFDSEPYKKLAKTKTKLHSILIKINNDFRIKNEIS
jgi:hypothetical protein